MKTSIFFPSTGLVSLLISIISILPYSQMAQTVFFDGFESGNFTTGGWTVTGNAEISTQSPSQGTYCVKGPGTYRIEKSFTNLNENIITVEYVMKASQTGSNCCQFDCWDANNNESAVVFFRHSGKIEAKDGPTGSNSIALMPYVADTWYNMKIVLDFTNKTYDVYINNVLKANDFGFYVPNYGSPQSFSWRSGETWGTGWVDNVNILGELQSASCDSLLSILPITITHDSLEAIMLSDGISQTLINGFAGNYAYKITVNGGGGDYSDTKMRLCMGEVTPLSGIAKGISDAGEIDRTQIGLDPGFVGLCSFNGLGWTDIDTCSSGNPQYMRLNSKWGSDIDTYIYYWVGTNQPIDTLGYSLLDPYTDDFGSISVAAYNLQSNISGFTKDLSNNPIQGVTLTFTNVTPSTVITDNNGFYTKTVPCDYSGTVTPTKDNYSFNPINRTYANVTTNQTNQDYTGSVGVNTTVFINPNAQTVNTSETFTTTVEIAQVTNLGGFELEIDFDPILLQANTVALGSFLGSTGRTVFPLTNSINNTTGLIEFAATTLGATPPGPNGNGILITVSWTATSTLSSETTTNLVLQNIQVTQPNGTIIPTTLQNGTVTISPCYIHDFDCDCDVDIVDVTMSAYCYGTSQGDPNYNPTYDLDNDGDIDIVDITMVAYDYGWTCTKMGLGNTLGNVSNDNVLVSFTPPMILNPKDGTFETQLFIENVQQLGGFEFKIGFDPEQLEIISIEQGEFLGNTNRTIFPLKNNIDKESGEMQYSLTTLGSEFMGASGEGALLKIICKPRTSDFKMPSLVQSQLVRIDAVVIDHTFKDSEASFASKDETFIINTYPNPFSHEMTVHFRVGKDGFIAFNLYDIFGRKLQSIEPEYMSPGIYYKTLYRKDLNTGMYLLYLEFDTKTVESKKITILDNK